MELGVTWRQLTESEFRATVTGRAQCERLSDNELAVRGEINVVLGKFIERAPIVYCRQLDGELHFDDYVLRIPRTAFSYTEAIPNLSVDGFLHGADSLIGRVRATVPAKDLLKVAFDVLGSSTRD